MAVLRCSTWKGAGASLLALLVIAGAVLATAGAASASGGRIAFREVAFASRGFNIMGEDKASCGRVLRTAAEATRLLRSWGLPTTVVKSTDFSRTSLVAVIAPYEPSSGYRARVARVDVYGHGAVITGAVGYEGGEMSSSSLERPWVVLAVSRSALAGVRRDAHVRLKELRRAALSG
jgi:hypothetical protein